MGCQGTGVCGTPGAGGASVDAVDSTVVVMGTAQHYLQAGGGGVKINDPTCVCGLPGPAGPAGA